MKVIKDPSQVDAALKAMRKRPGVPAAPRETETAAAAAAGSAKQGRTGSRKSPAVEAAAGAPVSGRKPPRRASTAEAPPSVYRSRIAPLPVPRDATKVTRAQMQARLNSVTMPRHQRAFTERIFKVVVPEEGLQAGSARDVLESLFRSLQEQSGSLLDNLTQEEFESYAHHARTTDFWGTIKNMMLVLLDSRRSRLQDPALDYKALLEEHLPGAEPLPGPPEIMRTAG